MANDTSSNGSSSSHSNKASAPLPSSSLSSDDSESPKSTPLKSSPPSPPSPPSPSPPSPSPPSPPEQSSPPPTEFPPPTPSKSPPPTPSKSPPPTPSTSPPPSPSKDPPPTPSKSPPPTPSRSPPPLTSPPTPPPDKSPPSRSHSPPPPSTPPPSKDSAPPPSPSEPPPSPPQSSPPPPENSPPSPQSHAPPPHSLSPPTAIPTPPTPSSHVTPPPAGSGPKHPSPPRSPPVPEPKSSGAPTKTKPSSSSPSSGNNTGEIVGLSLAGVFIIALLSLVIFFFIFKRKQKRRNIYVMPPPRKSQMKGGDVHYYVEEGGAQGTMHLRTSSDRAQHMNTGQLVFTYEKIAEITNGFSSESIIGEGGFGYVYKASMPDGRVGALKMLKAGSGQGEREFRAEVDIISRIHHRHLVSLIGYCISEQQRVLIYEYVPNGNLNQHLHGNEFPILDWPKRMKIAVGAARGLAYLHDGCNPKIIHRDIKSANILLDNAYEAQVADFGLARLTDDANTHVSTRVMGTFGYMAPEYATSGKLTDKSDVFSFGVVLLELITGRKPVDSTQPIGEESLVEWGRPLLLRAVETGDFGELVDPRLERQFVDSEMFNMIEAAAACVRHSAQKRPRMVQVARALDTGDQLYDLSNGVKYGESTVYNSGQYNEDITRFRRMVNGSFDDSEYDMSCTDYCSTVSREMSGSKHERMPYSAGSDSEFRVFRSQRSNAQNMSSGNTTHIQ